jgi:mannonate dehydratase
MGTVEGWKRLAGIVPSPSNGITFDCGVTREMGQDPVEVCRYFGSRDCINHVHYRNVRVRAPYQKYTEVFLDEGQIDMFAVMRELVRQKYPRLIYPEHPRALDADRELPGFHPYYPGGGSYVGYAYNVGYARAMLQAALTLTGPR